MPAALTLALCTGPVTRPSNAHTMASRAAASRGDHRRALRGSTGRAWPRPHSNSTAANAAARCRVRRACLAQRVRRRRRPRVRQAACPRGCDAQLRPTPAGSPEPAPAADGHACQPPVGRSRRRRPGGCRRRRGFAAQLRAQVQVPGPGFSSLRWPIDSRTCAPVLVGRVHLSRADRAGRCASRRDLNGVDTWPSCNVSIAPQIGAVGVRHEPAQVAARGFGVQVVGVLRATSAKSAPPAMRARKVSILALSPSPVLSSTRTRMWRAWYRDHLRIGGRLRGGSGFRPVDPAGNRWPRIGPRICPGCILLDHVRERGRDLAAAAPAEIRRLRARSGCQRNSGWPRWRIHARPCRSSSFTPSIFFCAVAICSGVGFPAGRPGGARGGTACRWPAPTSPHRPRRHSRSRWSAHSAAVALDRVRRRGIAEIGEIDAVVGARFARNWSRVMRFWPATLPRAASTSVADPMPCCARPGRPQADRIRRSSTCFCRMSAGGGWPFGCFLYCASTLLVARSSSLWQHHVVVDHGDDAIDGLRGLRERISGEQAGGEQGWRAVSSWRGSGGVVGGVVVDA